MLLWGEVWALSKQRLCIVSIFFLFFMIKCLNGSLKDKLLMYIAELIQASKLCPVLLLLIIIEINLQYTHTHPKGVSNKPTSPHIPAELALASFKWGA